MQGYTHCFPITYAATDVAIYQQDVVIHRSEGVSYEETFGDLKVWHVYVGNRCKSDYGDVRFTNSTGAELAYYLWPDYDSSSARFCVRLEGATSAGELQVWYGNPTATTTSDGDGTYLLHDHFDGTSLDTEKWVVSGQPYTVANGQLTVTGRDNASDNIRSSSAFSGAGITIEIRGRFTSISGSSYWGISSGGHADKLVSFDTLGYRIQATRNNASYQAGSSPISWRVWQAQWQSDASATVYDSDVTYQIPSQNVPRASQSLNIVFKQYVAGTSHVIDYVLVRAYSATPPAATALAPEQVSGTLHHVQGVVFGSANMMVI